MSSSITPPPPPPPPQKKKKKKTLGILTKVFCTSGPNLVVPAQRVMSYRTDKLKNGVNFDFEVKFDLEGQGQSPQKTIGILTKVFYTFGPNLAILAWTGPELSRGQASDWRTDWHTHTQTQAMTIPEGQNWPRVKMSLIFYKKNRRIWSSMTKSSHCLLMAWQVPWFLQTMGWSIHVYIKHQHYKV